jgi:hypothetical protein
MSRPWDKNESDAIMMKSATILIAALPLAAMPAWTGTATNAKVPAAVAATLDSVGQVLDDVELEDFGLTAARSFEDYQGRAVLIEFFAYW